MASGECAETTVWLDWKLLIALPFGELVEASGECSLCLAKRWKLLIAHHFGGPSEQPRRPWRCNQEIANRTAVRGAGRGPQVSALRRLSG
jgi:hypothetical protein